MLSRRDRQRLSLYLRSRRFLCVSPEWDWVIRIAHSLPDFLRAFEDALGEMSHLRRVVFSVCRFTMEPTEVEYKEQTRRGQVVERRPGVRELQRADSVSAARGGIALWKTLVRFMSMCCTI